MATSHDREIAKEWREDKELSLIRPKPYTYRATEVDAMLAAFHLDRLAQELGELAKEMCSGCRSGLAYGTGASKMTHVASPRYFRDCQAWAIRRRLAAIEQVRKEEG